MGNHIDILKGLHPSNFIERKMGEQNISLDALASATSIPYEIIDSVISGAHILRIENVP